MATPLGVRLGGSGRTDLDAVRRELQADRATYVYVTVSTVLVFAAFGALRGQAQGPQPRGRGLSQLAACFSHRSIHSIRRPSDS